MNRVQFHASVSMPSFLQKFGTRKNMYGPRSNRRAGLQASSAHSRGRCSENKGPFVAAISLDDREHTFHIDVTVAPGFTRRATPDRAKITLAPRRSVLSDGLACNTGVTRSGRSSPGFRGRRTKAQGASGFLLVQHHPGQSHDPPLWGLPCLCDFENTLPATRHAFSYRFNRHFRLEGLPISLLETALGTELRPEPRIAQPNNHASREG